MVSKFDLNGAWQLAGFDYNNADWGNFDSPYPVWAEVPGEVHPALMQAGVIDDPFQGDNAEKVKWIEDKEWWYRRTFRLPQEFLRSQTYLEFDGLDTYASVYLNGEEIGQAENMFVPYRFDVTGKLKEDDENTVEVRFEPAVKVLERMGIDFKSYYLRYNPIRIGARKMQASFGWDWLPRLIGAGIWLDARVASYDQLSIRDIYVVPQIMESGEAKVRVQIDVQSHVPHSVNAQLSLSIELNENKEKLEISRIIPTSGELIEAEIVLSDPKLWWPNGLGEHPLYTASVEILADGRMLDEKRQRFGIRTVDLVEQNEDSEPAFFFKINGVPVYAKGANWIPADGFPSRVIKDRYYNLLSLAKDANFNMLRAWGGAIYEKQEFYDFCDDLGIMVWQDFQFSLAEYPDKDWLANSVNTEAHSVIRQLRNHPSLVFWCGNNECEMDTRSNASWPGKRFFHEIIPEALRELDNTRPYWPSSPYGGDVAHSSDYGDYHGEPWFHSVKGEKDIHDWRYYLDCDKGLFMTEFPTQGIPEIESLQRILPRDQIFPPDGPSWNMRSMNNVQRQERIGMTSREALVKMIDEMMGEPKDADELAYFSGVLQGEFLRWQIEYYRRHKFNIGGSLFWCFNDAWPAIGYSVVDYYLRPKPAYYYIRRAFSPVALVFDEHEDGAGAWVVNDTLEPVYGTAWIAMLSFGSDPQWQEARFKVPPNGVDLIWTGLDPDDPNTQILIGSLEVDGETIYRSSFFFTVPRDLKLPSAEINVEKSYVDGEGLLILQLISDQYVHSVKLVGLPDAARPDDNYFDLFPHEARIIEIRGINAFEAEGVNPWQPKLSAITF